MRRIAFALMLVLGICAPSVAHTKPTQYFIEYGPTWLNPSQPLEFRQFPAWVRAHGGRLKDVRPPTLLFIAIPPGMPANKVVAAGCFMRWINGAPGYESPVCMSVYPRFLLGSPRSADSPESLDLQRLFRQP